MQNHEFKISTVRSVALPRPARKARSRLARPPGARSVRAAMRPPGRALQLLLRLIAAHAPGRSHVPRRVLSIGPSVTVAVACQRPPASVPRRGPWQLPRSGPRAPSMRAPASPKAGRRNHNLKLPAGPNLSGTGSRTSLRQMSPKAKGEQTQRLPRRRGMLGLGILAAGSSVCGWNLGGGIMFAVSTVVGMGHPIKDAS